MARTPEELENKLLAKDKAFADQLEAFIDSEMDKRYEGGIFTTNVGKSINLRVLKELRRRYSCWTIEYKEEQHNDPREPYTSYLLTFTPRGSSKRKYA